MTFQTVRNTINTHLTTQHGTLNKSELYREHGVRVSYVKAEKVFKLEVLGPNEKMANIALNDFINEIETALPLRIEKHSEFEVEYRIDKTMRPQKNCMNASGLFRITETPETIEEQEGPDVTEVILAETPVEPVITETTDETAETTDEPVIDNPEDYTYLMHVRNYNKRDLGDLHTVSFDHTELTAMTGIVEASNGTGGYQLVLQRINGLGVVEEVLKKYSAKKYALAQFVVPEAPEIAPAPEVSEALEISPVSEAAEGSEDEEIETAKGPIVTKMF